MPDLQIRLALASLLMLLGVSPGAAGTREAGSLPEARPGRAAARAREPRTPLLREQGPGSDGQTGPAAIADGSGGVIVAWEERRSGAVDIYLKRLDEGGTARWPAVAVCAATGSQSNPTIISDGAGGAIVAWVDRRSGTDDDIYAQHVRADGTVDPAWPADGRALCTATGDQSVLSLAADGAGGAIVTWEDSRAGATDLFAQRLLASGAVDPAWPANGRAVCTAAFDQHGPRIIPDGVGGAIVTWADGRSGDWKIFAQRVLRGGVVDPAWPADGRALCTAAGSQNGPAIASDGAGGAIVAWIDHRSGTDDDIYAQRVLKSGVVDPAWPADGRALCAASGGQSFPMIVADGAGGALVSWWDARGGAFDVYAQHVLAGGAADPVWPADGRALCTESGDQTAYGIVPDGEGGGIVTWMDTRDGSADVYAQRVRASGVVDPAWPAGGRALCTASGDQNSPAIVPDGRGGAIVAWEDHRDTNPLLRATRVSATGVESIAWTVDGIATCAAAGAQDSPAIVSDGRGGAIIAWEDDRSDASGDIYAQRVQASGAADPAWPADGTVLCAATSYQAFPAIVPDGTGGAIVTWEDYRGANADIYAQRVLASGAADPAWPANGRALCTATGGQINPAIVPDGAGGAFVAWSDNRGGAGNDIYAQRVLASGAVDPAWPVNGRALCTATGGQFNPMIAPDGAGGAIVVWEDSRVSETHIYAQRVLASGAADPSWPANGLALCTAAVGQDHPAIVWDGAGGAFVTWVDYRAFSADIYARRVLVSGTTDPAWPADGRALCTATGSQYSPAILADGAGGAFVAWEDNRSDLSGDIYVQRVLANGAVDPAWTADGVALCTAASYQASPSITTDGAGGAFVAWDDYRGGGPDIYAHRVLAGGTTDPGWPTDGRAVCTASGSQSSAASIPDGTGGAIVAWTDSRGAAPDIYAQRITRSGPVEVLWTPDGVTSALLSLESVEALPGAVRIVWHTSQAELAATVYRQEEGGGWAALATLVADGSGRLRCVDQAVSPGRRYGYRLGVRSGAGEIYLGEVWLTIPSGATLRLDGLRPNPARRDLVVAFSLAHAGDTTLELLDVAGRGLLARRLTGLAAGDHLLSLGDGAVLPAGVYLIRLTQDGRSFTRKAVVAR